MRLAPRGVFAAYREAIIAADPWSTDRPRPIGLSASEQAAEIRAGFSAWHGRHSTGQPPPSEPLTLRQRIAHLWYADDA